MGRPLHGRMAVRAENMHHPASKPIPERTLEATARRVGDTRCIDLHESPVGDQVFDRTRIKEEFFGPLGMRQNDREPGLRQLPQHGPKVHKQPMGHLDKQVFAPIRQTHQRAGLPPGKQIGAGHDLSGWLDLERNARLAQIETKAIDRFTDAFGGDTWEQLGLMRDGRSQPDTLVVKHPTHRDSFGAVRRTIIQTGQEMDVAIDKRQQNRPQWDREGAGLSTSGLLTLDRVSS